MYRIIIALLLVCSSFASGQGLYWESVAVTKGTNASEKHSRFYYLPGKIKIESVENNNAVIYYLDKQIVVSLDHEKKMYRERTFADMDVKVREDQIMVKQKRDIMAQKLKEMPPDERKTTEEMLEENMSGLYFDIPVEVIRTDTVQTIGNFQCTKFVVKRGKRILQTLWTTPNVPNFSLMRKDLLHFSQRIALMSPINGPSIAEALKDVDGFPMKAEVGLHSVTTVTKVETRAVAPSEFEIPRGYNRDETKKKK